MEILYSDVDKAEMPPGSGSEDRPWYWYVPSTPENEECANPECECVAHMGLVFMTEDDKDDWVYAQDVEETFDADVVFYCVMHFIPAVERLSKSIT